MSTGSASALASDLPRVASISRTSPSNGFCQETFTDSSSSNATFKGKESERTGILYPASGALFMAFRKAPRTSASR